MKIEHNSRALLYRTPFGAVTKNTEITLRLALMDFGIPTHIRLVYEFSGKTDCVNMSYVFEVAGAYIYEAKITAPDSTGLMHYYFDIASKDGQVYYGNNTENLGGIGSVFTQKPHNKYQITVYDEGYQTPKWWKDSVCYQIFPDRFFNGNEDNSFLDNRNGIIKRNWGDEPFYKAEQFGGEYLCNDFFGGNLIGIEKKLPYLKELGISCIYLNPIFKAYSNHRYDTGDYKTIDPMLGTEQDFKHLCKSAQKLGIKIILDGVFNHTGSDSLYFNKKGTYNSVGAYQSQNSPYYKWYRFSNFPEEYESWWGITTLPQTEENSESYQNYILKNEDAVVKKWLKAGASGWRLDVVDELPDFFVEILREEVKKQNPEAVIIGEVWEDASNKIAYNEQRQYFMGKELDSVMNYPLRNALIGFINQNIDAEALDRRIMSIKENYPKPAFFATLNFLSSHDTERILTVMGNKKASGKDAQAYERLNEHDKSVAISKLKCIITMQALLPGVPTIFYGDESGIEGYSDPFCRRCFPWGKENAEIMEHYKQNIRLRNENEVFKTGEFETIYKFENGYGFIRYDDKDSFIVLVNSGSETTFRLDAARFGVTSIQGVFHQETYSSQDGIYFINMPEKSVKVFKRI